MKKWPDRWPLPQTRSHAPRPALSTLRPSHSSPADLRRLRSSKLQIPLTVTRPMVIAIRTASGKAIDVVVAVGLGGIGRVSVWRGTAPAKVCPALIVLAETAPWPGKEKPEFGQSGATVVLSICCSFLGEIHHTSVNCPALPRSTRQGTWIRDIVVAVTLPVVRVIIHRCRGESQLSWNQTAELSDRRIGC